MRAKLLKLRGQIFKGFFYVADLLCPKKKNLFLFGSGSGRSYTNNGRYLYEWTKRNNPELEAVWVSKDKVISDHLNKKFGPGSALHKGEPKLFWILLRARVVFVTHGSKDVPYQMFQPSLRKLVVQLWHGIGTKAVGYMDPGSDKKMLKWENKKYDIVVSNSYVDTRYSAQIFNFPTEKIWPLGSPKTDGLTKRRSGKIKRILYAPTYGAAMLFPFPVKMKELDDFLVQAKVELLISAHRNDYKLNGNGDQAGEEYHNIQFIDQGPLYDIQENINRCDALFTDYSSVFWDFMAADKPVFFVCSKKARGSINEKIVMDYEVMTGGRIAYNYDEMKDYLTRLNDYEIEDKPRRDLMIRIFFEREMPNLCASAAIIERAKGEIGLIG